MKRVFTWMLVLINICGCLCLVYFGYLFVSGNTTVDAPDAMLPMERWERGGLVLTIGMVPLIIANALGYNFFQSGSKKSRLFMFIPSIVCIGLVVCYWIKSFTL